MDILIATNNTHKRDEIKEILKSCRGGILVPSDLGKLPEPVENGDSYRENALIKAMHYYRLTKIPSIADDSGIEIDAFNGEPGIFSARYIDPALSYAQRNEKVMELLQNVPPGRRGARFRCCCVFVINEDDIRTEYGTLEGSIGFESVGEYGFGYDPIFRLEGRELYLAEIHPEEKNRISHRALAFKKMEKHIMEIFGRENERKTE